jgi:hypothetical protein
MTGDVNQRHVFLVARTEIGGNTTGKGLESSQYLDIPFTIFSFVKLTGMESSLSSSGSSSSAFRFLLLILVLFFFRLGTFSSS